MNTPQVEITSEQINDIPLLLGIMEDMGIRPGKEVEMLNNGGGGALLVKVDDSRIAVGRGMAMKIMVRRQGR